MVVMDISGQSKKETKGDKLMDTYSFSAATESYKAALEDGKDSERIKLKLAECYRMLNDPENTSYWYGEVIKEKELQQPIDKYYYALALVGTGEVQEAQKWFDAYSKEVRDFFGGGDIPVEDSSKIQRHEYIQMTAPLVNAAGHSLPEPRPLPKFRYSWLLTGNYIYSWLLTYDDISEHHKGQHSHC